ncbi:helix-turn-helix domain-containing protein [Streptomyces sp. NPDC004959]|uniref:helix-turn-helix domain-containing protein n=1 Tax=unclassified Streptomyces TaxID=2593676 RepID=UPI0033BB89D3
MPTANLLLHPVRMRILQTLVGSEDLTTAQLRSRMPDVPTATMYRHIAVLTRAGILEVVSERPVRGTVERTYRVRQEKALVADEERPEMTKEDHRQAFTVFTGALAAGFDRYLAREDSEPAREGVMYRQGAVWLTDEEFAALVRDLEEVAARYSHHGPDDGRVRHLLSLVVVPDKPGAEPG